MSLHELVMGGLPLDGLTSVMSDEGWLLRVKSASSGTAFGTSEAVESVVDAMGADGGQARIDGYANAKTTLQLQILGVDATALAKGEAAVRRVLPDGWGAPVDLLWRPPDGLAPASVRVVLTGVLGSPSESSEWDRDELRLARTYPLVLTHLPHVRSEYPTVTTAHPPGGAVGTVWFGGTTVGWSTIPTGQLIDNTATDEGVAAPAGVPLQWQDTHEMVGRWITVEGIVPPQVSATVSGVTHLIQPTYAWTGHATYRLPTTGTLTRLAWYPPAAQALSITRVVSRVNPPNATRQTPRTIVVGGTERTPGTLTVSARDGESPLGLTLVHTCPDDGTGYDPDLSPWIYNGAAEVPDLTAPMGGWRPLSEFLNTLIPWYKFSTDQHQVNTYQVGIIVRSPVAQQITLEWSVWAWVTEWPTLHVREERIVDLPETAPGALVWIPLGRTSLPTTHMRRGGSVIGIEQTSGTTVDMGGMYAFRAGRDSALTVIDSPEPHLFIKAGSGRDPGSWLIGEEADGSDAYTPPVKELIMPGVHVFRAGRVASYVITGGVADPAVNFTHYHNWTANAADDGTTP